jgi:hypothetical protein
MCLVDLERLGGRQRDGLQRGGGGRVCDGPPGALPGGRRGDRDGPAVAVGVGEGAGAVLVVPSPQLTVVVGVARIVAGAGTVTCSSAACGS